MTQKIVINNQFGGFSLSGKACLRLRELGNPIAIAEVMKGETWPDGTVQNYDFDMYCSDIPRDDPQLFQVMDELGEGANGNCATLKIVEIPDGVEWQIEEYDGNEWIAEKHRRWF